MKVSSDGLASSDRSPPIGARGLAVESGTAFVVGSTDGVLHGTTSLGGVDAFVRAYDTAGGLAWGRQFGSAGTDEATSISAHPGGSYVAGFTDGALPGQTALGGSDAFVMKLNGSGDRVWTHQTGTSGSDEAIAVAATAKAVYLAGSTTGAFPGQLLLGETDAFVQGYEPKGTELWSLQFGTEDYDQVSAFALGSGAGYVTGTTHGAFEGQVNAGDRDVFLTKIAFS